MTPALANIEQARALLVEADETAGSPLAALGAAAFAATAAIAMAGVMVLGPAVGLGHSNTVSEAVAPL